MKIWMRISDERPRRVASGREDVVTVSDVDMAAGMWRWSTTSLVSIFCLGDVARSFGDRPRRVASGRGGVYIVSMVDMVVVVLRWSLLPLKMVLCVGDIPSTG